MITDLAVVTSLSPLTRPVTLPDPLFVNVTGSSFTPTSLCTYTTTTASTSFPLTLPSLYASTTAIACLLPSIPFRSASSPLTLRVSSTNASVTSLSSLSFAFTPPLVLTASWPAVGRAAGGTVVTVFGGPFTQSSLYRCSWNATGSTAVVFLNASALSCVAPAAVTASTSPAPLTVSDNAFDYQDGGLTFTWLPDPPVLDASPSASSVLGGTLINVTLSAPCEPYQLWCQVGDVVALALSPEAGEESAWVLCSSPPVDAAGNATLSLSYDPLSFPAPLVNLTYFAAPLLAAIAPSVGPVGGGTLVNLTFSHPLPASVPVLCSINGTLSAPAQSSSAWILCTTAPALSSTTSAVLIGATVGDRLELGEWFTYLPVPTVSAVYPASYLSDQTQTLYIHGSSFAPSASLSCAFVDATNATTVIAATFLTSSSLSCTTPSSALSSPWLAVSVSNLPSSASFSSSSLNVSTPSFALSSVTPSSGPTLPYFFVVTGTSFPNASTLSCVVDGIDFAAVWVSPTTLTCSTNALRLAGEGSRALTVRVRSAQGNASVSSVPYPPSPPIVLSSIEPLITVYTGGTLLTLSGSQFRADSSCTFDVNASPSAFLSMPLVTYAASQVTCYTPDLSPVTGLALPVFVSVAVVDSFFSSNPIALTALSPATVTAVTPSVGWVGWNTTVTVTGSGFLPTNVPVFSLGDVAVAALYLSASKLLLPLPGWAFLVNFSTGFGLTTTAGCASLSLTLSVLDDEGLTTFPSPVTFTYFNTTQPLSMAPLAGAVHGGTVITLTTTPLFVSATLRCRVDVQQSAPLTASTSGLECVAPSHVAGNVSVWFSINAYEWQLAGYFVFYHDLHADALSPLTALPEPSTTLTITGSNLSPTPLYPLTLLFNATASTTCSVTSSTTIQCPTPTLDVGRYSLALTANGLDVFSTALVLTVRGQWVVTSVSPAAGSVTGGTVVLVTGQFASSATFPVYCQFGVVVVQGVWLSTTSARCTAPAQSAGAVAVELGSNQQLWTSSGITFVYYAAPTVVSISPALGPSTGGTVVLVSGSNFPMLSTFSCRFASTLTPATVQSSTSVTCLAPALLAGNHSFAVSPNAADELTPASTFETYAPPRFLSVAPPAVPQGSSTLLMLLSSAPLVYSTVSCRFTSQSGSVVTSAAAVFNASVVECSTPSAAATGWLTLAVAMNGVDYTETGLQVRVLSVAALIAATPPSASIAGGAIITVSGTAFSPSTQLSCSINGLLTPMTFLTTTAVLCLVPPSLTTGSVPLLLASPTGVAFSSSLMLTYHPAVAVNAPTPAAVLSTGGAVLSFTASWVDPSLQLQCAFYGQPGSSATVTSTTAFTCVAPAMLPSTSAVVRVLSLYDATIDFDFTVSVVPPPTILSLSPTSGAMAGGTAVTVTGLSFLPSSSCQFTQGSSVITAALLSTPTSIVCLSPSLGSAGTATVTVSTLPAGSFTSPWATFEYLLSPVVSSVHPEAVPVARDVHVLVTLSGSNFVASSTSLCGFNITSPTTAFVSSSALATSASSLECVVPAMAVSTAAFNATLAVSINGVEWYPSTVVLSFLPPIVLTPAAYAYVVGEDDLLLVWGQGLLGLPSSPSLVLRCVFGFDSASVFTYAMPINASLVVCPLPLPPASSATAALIASLVVTDGVLSSVATVTVAFFPAPVLQSLSTAMPTPGTWLTIRGLLFPASADCIFSSSSTASSLASVVVTAVVLSSSTVSCVVPALPYNASSAYYVAVAPTGLTVTPPTLAFLPLFSTPQASAASTSSLSSVYPSTVRVLVNNLDGSYVNSPSLSCMSDSGTYAALYINSSAMICLLPSSVYPYRPSFPLFVGNTPSLMSSPVLAAPPATPLLTSASPASLSTGPLLLSPTTAVVTVTGTSMAPSSSLSCVLSGLYVPAVYVNATTVWCALSSEVLSLVALTSLTSAPLSLSLSLTNDGVDLSVAAIPLVAAPSPTIGSVQPTHADPTTATVFTVTGSAFTAGDVCVFQSASTTQAIVAAGWVDASHVTCAVDGGVMAAGVVVVSVTTDVSVMPTSSATVVLAAVALSSLSASFGPDDGGALLTLIGSAFLPPPVSSFCVFDRLASLVATSTPLLWSSPATFLNASTVTCTVPGHAPGNVTVDVLMDAQLSSPSLYFTYTAELRIVVLQPAWAVVTDVGTISLEFDASLAALLSVAPAVTLSCAWDAEYVSTLTVVNATTGWCALPSVSTPASYTAEVTVVDATRAYASNPLPFTFLVAPSIASFHPALGPVSGGTTLTISGVSFPTAPTPSCVFNVSESTSTLATVLSSTTLTCVTPPSSAGPVSVQVCASPTSCYGLPAPFVYVPTPTVSSVPSPAYAGSTLYVTGSSFIASSPALSCLFAGTTLVWATFADASHMYCVLPLLPGVLTNETVTVAVSNDGSDWSTAVSTLYLIVPLEPTSLITALTPVSGTPSGGTVLSVTGANFLPTSTLACLIGLTVVPAVYVNATALTCVTPAYAPGEVAVSVSNDGSTFSSISMPFTYALLPVVSSAVTAYDGSGQLVVTVTGLWFTPSVLCAFVSNASQWYPYFGSAELPELPAVVYSSPLMVTSATQLTCAAPPLTDFLSAETGALGNTSSLTSLTSLVETVVSVSVVPDLVTPLTTAFPFVYHELTTPTVTSMSSVVMTDAVPYYAVDVFGGTFIDNAALACRYTVTSASPTPVYQPMTAVYLSPTHVLCRVSSAIAAVPPSQAAVVAVTVDGWSWVSGGSITFVPPPVVVSLSPAALTADVSLPLYVTGSGPLAGYGGFGVPVCAVGGSVLPGSFVNSSAVLCILRPADYYGVTTPLQVAVSLDGWAWSNSLYLQPLLLVTVLSSQPPYGPVVGGTVVTLTGSSFTNASQCAFVFDATSLTPSQSVPAAAVTVLSSTALLCTAPASPASLPLRALVRAYNSPSQLSVSWPPSSASFTYLEPWTFASLAPTYGPVGGSVVLTVTGSGFVPLPTLACLFTAVGSAAVNSTVSAVYVSASVALCTVSMLANSTSYSVQVTVDGLSYLSPSSAFPFVFVPLSVVSAVLPAVLDESLQTVVTVTGANLTSVTPALSTFCLFDGAVLVAATVTSSTTATCTAPSASAFASQNSAVRVQVQLGSSVLSSTSATVRYVASPIISSVYPRMGSTAGGVSITLSGVHFLPTAPSSTLVLSIANASSTTTYPVTPLSDHLCTFVMPASSPGAASLTLSVNADDLPLFPVVFTYYAPPTLTSVSPTSVPYHGGSIVTVIGSTFPQAAASCVFGSIAVPPLVTVSAQWVDAQHVICVTPLLLAGAVPVTLSFAPSSLATANAVTLTATPDNVIASAYPTAASNTTLSPYQWLTLTFSSSFLPNASMTCLFASTVTVLVTDTTAGGVGCLCPALGYTDPTPVSVAVMDDQSNAVYATTVIYQSFVQVTAVYPAVALNRGGAVLTVRGARMLQQGLQCTCTDGVTTLSLPVNATGTSTGVCAVPAWAKTGTVTLQVTTTQPMPSPAVSLPSASFVFASSPTVLWMSALTYFAPFTVATVAPSMVSADFDGVLTVVGSGFNASAPLYCSFGGTAESAAMVFSSTVLKCPVPQLASVPSYGFTSSGPVQVVGNVSVTVLLGSDPTTNDASTALFVLLTSPPSLSSYAPLSAAALMAFNITLMGSSFLPSTPYACSVTDSSAPAPSVPLLTVNAVYVNATVVACPVPSLPSSTYDVQLVSSSSLVVPYIVLAIVVPMTVSVVPALVITSVSPVLISSAGGTVLTIIASTIASPCQCRFGGSVLVTGSFVGGAMQCVTPTAAALGGGGSTGLEVACSPLADVWVSPQLVLTFFTPPTLTSMVPATGVTSMNASVYLRGASFLPVASLGCSFTQGNTSVSVPATYLSPTLIVCQPMSSLPYSTLSALSSSAYAGLGLGMVTVAATLNGVDYSTLSVAVPLFAVPPTLSSTAPLLASVWPSVASTTGGTLVTVSGERFDVLSSSSAVCVFGGWASSTAAYVNSTTMTCATPVGMPPAALTLSVSYNALYDDLPTLAGSSSLPFTFVAAPIVLSIHPTSGPTVGGTVITVHGEAFSPTASCMVGGVVATYQWVSGGLLLCTSPSGSAGTALFEVSNTGTFDALTNRSSNWARLIYYVQPVVVALSPTFGPATGNTTVTITLSPSSALAPSTSLSCRFGGALSPLPALYVDATHVACLSPSQSPATVYVDVALNGADYTDSAVSSPSVTFTFTVSPPPSLTSVFPLFGPTSGGVALTINGYNLIPSPSSPTITCLFSGLASTAATALSSTALTCLTPPGASNATVEVEVQLTPVGSPTAVTTSSGLSFTFMSPGLSALTPTLVATEGTTVVAVTGSGFASLPGPVACVFNEWTTVLAVVVSDGLLTCTAPLFSWLGLPAVFPALCTFTISWESGNIVSDTALTLYYAPTPVLSSISPSTGVSTLITVAGTGFLPTPLFSCSLGAVVVAASYYSSTLAYCVAPRQPPSAVEFSVSLNLVDWAYAPSNYTYVYDVDVNGSWPLLSPLSGGVTVTLMGSRFIAGPALACLFTPPSAVVAAVWVSSSQVTCVTPAVDLPGPSGVQLTVDGLNYTDAKEATVLYTAATVISAFSPPSSYASVNTTLSVTGLNFLSSPAPTCTVDSVGVGVTFGSSPVVQCGLGDVPAGVVLVTVGPNAFATTSSAPFVVYPAPSLSSVTPPRVSQSLAPTTALITGTNFSAVNAIDLLCAFTSSTPSPLYPLLAALTYLNPDAVSCTLPTSLAPVTASLSLVLASAPSVQVSTNALPFTFDPDYWVLSFSPQSAPYTVITTITITGVGFIDSPLTQCRYGLTYTQTAVFVSSTTLLCTLPPRFFLTTLTTSMYVEVLLTTNGNDYILLTPPFRYLLPSDCLPGTVCPPSALLYPNASDAGQIAECPPGSMCAGTDHSTPCSAGWYQPYAGQTFCLLCPPAFYCPVKGLLWPLLCPAGFICHSFGTVNPQSTRCNAGHVCISGVVQGDVRVANVSDAGASAIAEARAGIVHGRRLLAVPDTSPGSSTAGLLQQLAALELAMNGSINATAVSAVFAILYADLSNNGSVHLPSECGKGFYCLPGTGLLTSSLQSTAVQLNSTLLSPIPCFPGYLCPTASVTPLGSSPCPRSFYCPDSVSAYPCPVGAYCPGATLEPIPCPPSTYNNATGMAACILCPIGHYCPWFGLFLPVLCPGGLICSRAGLIQSTELCPAGYWCDGGTTTSNPNATVTTKPQPCPSNYFCLNGTASGVPVAGNFSTPQLCTGGRYCLNATASMLGTAICPLGAYCPPGSSTPIEASVGWFVDYLGAPIEYQCLPGSFAPEMGSASCLPCPAGYSCQTVGADVALICPRGYYHALSDIICEACPRGTFSEVRGLPDASLCQPCLAGFVCGQEGLTGMDGATQCIEGYVCGEGTTPAGQYDSPCPPGFVCGQGTTPQSQYNLLCPAGYTCSGGVAESESTRSVCRKGYYCPPGVYDADPIGYTLAAQCIVRQSSAIMDDYGCGSGNITVHLPYGDPYVRPIGQCPLGTTSAISAQHLDECTVDPAWADYPNPVWEFSPLDFAQVPAPPADVDVSAGCPYGYACPDYNDTLNMYYPSPYRSASLVELHLGHMDYAVITLYWGSLSSNLTYGQDFELLVYTGVVDTAGEQPTSIALPYGFTSSSVSQQATLRLGFMCFSNTTLTLSVGILHGLYLPQAVEFVNTGVVSIVQPSRAVTGTRDIFVTVYDFLGRSLYQPINLPRLTTELPYGYMLESITLDPSVSLVLNPAAEQITEDISSAMDAEGISNFAFSYLPYFSNCRGYDSYINLHVVLQDNASCTLVDPSQVVSVGNFDFLASPNSDSCAMQTACLFEEDMSEVTPFPRWFDKSADQNTMFYIAQSPFDASQWDSLPIRTYADLANYYASELDQDTLVAIIVNRDQNADADAFPRIVALAIEYQQTDANTKKIITGSVTLSNFSTDLSDASYTLSITFTPLTYFGLVNNFVFNETIFTIIYLIIGAISVAAVGIMWLLHRITTRLHFPPSFRLTSYMAIMFPHTIMAFVLWAGFPFLVSYILYVAFVVPDVPLFASISGNVAGELGSSSFDTTQIPFYAAGRIGAILLALAMYSMWAGARMFIPERRKKKTERKARDGFLDPDTTHGDPDALGVQRGLSSSSSSDEEQYSSLVLDAHDVYWTPKAWKRSNFLLVSIFTDLALLCSIEFSYSNLFNQNQWPVIIAFKVAEIPIIWLLRQALQEDLLTMPHQVIVDLTQFMITVGASNFVNFIIGFFVQDVALKYVERVWRDDAVEFVVKKTKHALKRWEKLTKSKAEEEAEEKEKEEIKALGKRVDGDSDSEDDVVAPVLNSHETSEQSLGPLIEFYSDYSAKVTSLFFSPFLMYFLYQFRQATQMTIGWGIPQHDMFFYFLFICVLLPFMTIIDVIIVNVKELCHFWKLHDYLVYLQHRFDHRTEWWQMHGGADGDMDMAVPRAVRSLDHLAFSGQYYLMLLVHTGGMMFLIIALQIFIHNNYNPFNDLLALVLFALTLLVCFLYERASILLARTIHLWPLQPHRSRLYLEQQYRTDTGIIPSWEQGYVAQIEKLKASQWYSEEGMRTIGFKQRWIKANKGWLMEELMAAWRREQEQAGKKGEGERKDGDDEGEDEEARMVRAGEWLSEWEGASGAEREALLERMAKALGLEENWERLEAGDADDDDAAYQGWLSMRAKEDRDDDLQEMEAEAEAEAAEAEADDNPLMSQAGFAGAYTGRTQRGGPYGGEPTQRGQRTPRSQFGVNNRHASRHRAHLLALSYRFLQSRFSPTCGVCQQPHAELLMQLKVPLKTVVKRWYARKRREAAITARVEGDPAVDKRRIYGRVRRREWNQWMVEEEDWRTVCRECIDLEEQRRAAMEEQDEEDDGPAELVVVDVRAYIQKERERNERLKAEGLYQSEATSSSSDGSQHGLAASAPHSSDDDTTDLMAAYWHQAERGEQTGRSLAISSDSVSTHGDGSDLSTTMAPTDVRPPLPRLDISDDSDDGRALSSAQPALAPQPREDISDDSDTAVAPVNAPQPREDISPDSTGDVTPLYVSAGKRMRETRSNTADVSRPSTSHMSSGSVELRREDAQHGLVGLGRLDVSDDSDSDDQPPPIQQAQVVPPLASAPGARSPPVVLSTVHISDDSDEEEEEEKGGAAPMISGLRPVPAVQVVLSARRADISDDSDEEQKQ